jgi:S-adenosylmethionine hydrolase
VARPIVLLTDYGSGEFYTGVTRSVLLAASPSSVVIDLTHDIPAHDVARASFVLARSLEYLPTDAVVVVVIDPGVGTDRRAIAIKVEDRVLIGPDNGFASDLLASGASARFMSIDAERAAGATGKRPRGDTFHGRDVFAPVAGAIARGAALNTLGAPTDRVVMLQDVPSVSIDGGRVHGTGRHIDRFGNVLTDIPRAAVERAFGKKLERVRVRVGSIDAGPLRRAYAEGAAGALVALFNSWDLVEAAVSEGRACDLLGTSRPADIRFELYTEGKS